jgi:hypothetical protein
MRTHIKTTVVLVFLLVSTIAGAAQRSGRWELLGERQVDFRNDHDQIDVGRRGGPFKELQLRVKNAPIEIFNMVVTFENGQTFKPNLRHRFEKGSGSRVIDLPGERRIIKRIDFYYKSLSPRKGKGVVSVLGR